MSLLQIKNLSVAFQTLGGEAKVIENLNLTLDKGVSLGIVGESGSGKSVTSLAIMRLLADNATVTGEIIFGGRDLLSLSEREMQKVRGKSISMIFQEPMTSLNPIKTCGFQIMEPMFLHSDISKKEAKSRAIELLSLCGIPAPEERFSEYPHQLSGGQRQRVMIAAALAEHPELLIADEPTTALDVTIQAQILDLMKSIREKTDMSIIMITHDLGVVSDFCDRVLIFYTGQVVENAPAEQVFADPLHPYSKGLIGAIPVIGQHKDRLESIEGMVPDASAMPSGCHFHPRCKFAFDRCQCAAPPLYTLDDGRQVRCFLYDTEDGK